MPIGATTRTPLGVDERFSIGSLNRKKDSA